MKHINSKFQDNFYKHKEYGCIVASIVLQDGLYVKYKHKRCRIDNCKCTENRLIPITLFRYLYKKVYTL